MHTSRNTLSRISCLTKIVTVDSDLILYQFSRSKVERGTSATSSASTRADKLPEGRRLREMMNCFVFCIEGWDSDPREIHLIPEVRRFYSAFHEAWPYWLYFCNLDVDTLRSMVMCCLPDVSTMQVDGKTKVAVTFDPLDVLNFIKHDFMPMNADVRPRQRCSSAGFTTGARRSLSISGCRSMPSRRPRD